jgi:transcriptional regulator with XRE-family HTH domain
MTSAEKIFAIEFGKRIKKLRRISNFSQTGFGDAVGVHRNTIAHWEKGEALISLLDAMRIVGVIHCDLNCLLPGSAFVWGRELPKRPPVRYATLKQLVDERDPPLTRTERAS